jgi:hypothetical protein
VSGEISLRSQNHYMSLKLGDESVLKGGGSLTRGAWSETRRDPAEINPCLQEQYRDNKITLNKAK